MVSWQEVQIRGLFKFGDIGLHAAGELFLTSYHVSSTRSDARASRRDQDPRHGKKGVAVRPYVAWS